MTEWSKHPRSADPEQRVSGMIVQLLARLDGPLREIIERDDFIDGGKEVPPPDISFGKYGAHIRNLANDVERSSGLPGELNLLLPGPRAAQDDARSVGSSDGGTSDLGRSRLETPGLDLDAGLQR
jgi:hypothetical protein